jgi:hypothetical protein
VREGYCLSIEGFGGDDKPGVCTFVVTESLFEGSQLGFQHFSEFKNCLFRSGFRYLEKRFGYFNFRNPGQITLVNIAKVIEVI